MSSVGEAGQMSVVGGATSGPALLNDAHSCLLFKPKLKMGWRFPGLSVPLPSVVTLNTCTFSAFHYFLSVSLVDLGWIRGPSLLELQF